MFGLKPGLVFSGLFTFDSQTEGQVNRSLIYINYLIPGIFPKNVKSHSYSSNYLYSALLFILNLNNY